MTNQNSQTPVERLMEEVYDRFEAAWASDVIPQVENYLPVGLPLEEERRVLLEMVLIDLENRWQRFHISSGVNSEFASDKAAADFQGIPRCPLLEDYCQRYSKLGAAENISSEAIAFEFRVRSRLGTSPQIHEYTRRFAKRARELMTILTGSGSNQEINAADTGPVSQPEETVVEPPSAIPEPSARQPPEDGIEISSLRYPVP